MPRGMVALMLVALAWIALDLWRTLRGCAGARRGRKFRGQEVERGESEANMANVLILSRWCTARWKGAHGHTPVRCTACFGDIEVLFVRLSDGSEVARAERCRRCDWHESKVREGADMEPVKEVTL